MRAAVFEPRYSMNAEELDACFTELLSMMRSLAEPLDVIVLPEYSDVPADVSGEEAFYRAAEENGPTLLREAAAMAVRCHAYVFVNAAHKTEGGLRNTTHVLDREGKVVGRYFKAHPAPSEVKRGEEGGHGLDVAYSYRAAEPYVLTLEGVRFGFLTCYDFYFYEAFSRLSRERVDVIIGCSLQRTDTHEALSILCRHLAYETNAYLLRSSVSLGEDSPVGGCSMAVSPFGEEIFNRKNRVGIEIFDFDPHKKYGKPAGHGGAISAHHEYIEEGRRPWLYRNGGPSVVPFDRVMPYPRLCAHRGFNSVAPENSLPAFGAAVALGAEEIEFDVYSTRDGVLVSCHDNNVERVSDGHGRITDLTYEELLTFDFGKKHGEKFAGLKIPTLEEILCRFGGRVVMNLHIKIWDLGLADDKMEEIVSLLRRYDCERHCYFMTSNDEMLKKVRAYAPEIGVCVGWDGNPDPMSMVDRAIALGVDRIQLFKPHFTEKTVKRAHENGIKCNVFFADDVEEAKRYRAMGIDCILTNDYLAVKTALGE